VVLIEGPESWRCSRLRLQDTRSELQTAYDTFADMGAAGFAERARIGLSDWGEGPSAGRQSSDRRDAAGEAGRNAGASGAANREVAAELLSARLWIITYATCTRSWVSFPGHRWRARSPPGPAERPGGGPLAAQRACP
jgi:hypothetical protein